MFGASRLCRDRSGSIDSCTRLHLTCWSPESLDFSSKPPVVDCSSLLVREGGSNGLSCKVRLLRVA